MHLLESKKILSLSLFFLFSSFAFAADLTISPVKVETENGRPFTVTFSITNNSSAINALSGSLIYPKDLLKLTSFSKVGSIVQMWSEDPKVKSPGSASFEGVILNPGYSNEKGTVLKATFLPLTKGTGTISFISGNIYANDGDATDIVRTLGSAEIIVGDKKTQNVAEEIKTETLQIVMPKKAEKGSVSVTSITHPEEERWYPSNEVTVLLGLRASSTWMSYTYGLEEDIADRIKAKPASSLSFASKGDGAYLFKIKEENNGVWGADTVYRINVDTEAPYDTLVQLPSGASSTKMYQTVTLSAKDAHSGVSFFEIALNGGPVRRVQADSNGQATFPLPKAKHGENELSVSVVDIAGNKSVERVAFTVLPLESPKIVSLSDTVSLGSIAEGRILTYPYAEVEVSLGGAKEKRVLGTYVADEMGSISFSYLMKKMEPVTFFAQITRFEGGESAPEEMGEVKVRFRFSFFFKALLEEGRFMLLIGLMLFLFGFFLSRFLRMFSRPAVPPFPQGSVKAFFSDVLAELEKDVNTEEKKEDKS